MLRDQSRCPVKKTGFYHHEHGKENLPEWRRGSAKTLKGKKWKKTKLCQDFDHHQRKLCNMIDRVTSILHLKQCQNTVGYRVLIENLKQHQLQVVWRDLLSIGDNHWTSFVNRKRKIIVTKIICYRFHATELFNLEMYGRLLNYKAVKKINYLMWWMMLGFFAEKEKN